MTKYHLLSMCILWFNTKVLNAGETECREGRKENLALFEHGATDGVKDGRQSA